MRTTIDVATSLIERPSITPDDAGCQLFVREILGGMGFEIVDYSEGDTTNTWAVLRFGDGPVLGFAAHTDVVSPGNRDDWVVRGRNIDPFTVTEIGGNYYGRGIADMKGGLAAMLTATEEFLGEHGHGRAELYGGIAFLITSDEEGSGRYGTRVLANKLKALGTQLDYCIVGEASSIKQTGDCVYTGRRGSYHLLEMVIKGLIGHVAKQNGINAAEVVARLIAAAYDAEWEDELYPGFGPTTFEVTILESSSKQPGGDEHSGENVTPSSALVRANWRFSPATSPTAIQKRFMSLARAAYAASDNGIPHPENAISATWALSGEPFSTPVSSPLVVAVQRALRESTGRIPELSTAGGTSDGRFIGPILGAHVVELGLPGGTIHTPKERVPVKSLPELHAVYKALLRALLVKTA